MMQQRSSGTAALSGSPKFSISAVAQTMSTSLGAAGCTFPEISILFFRKMYIPFGTLRACPKTVPKVGLRRKTRPWLLLARSQKPEPRTAQGEGGS